MQNIKINLHALESKAGYIQDIAYNIGYCQKELKTILNSIDNEILTRDNINNKSRDIDYCMGILENSTYDISKFLRESVSAYEQAEKDIDNELYQLLNNSLPYSNTTKNNEHRNHNNINMNQSYIQSHCDPMVYSYLSQITKDIPALDKCLNGAPYNEKGRIEQIKEYLRKQGYDVPYNGGIEPRMFNTLNYLRGSNDYVFEKITSRSTQIIDNNEPQDDDGWFSWVDDALDWAGDKLNNAVDDVKNLGDDIGDWFGDRCEDVQDWYSDNHVGDYLYAGVEIVGGVATTGVSVVGAVMSGGTLGLPTFISAVHGVNSVINGVNDLHDINNGTFNRATSENLLRDRVYKPVGKGFGWMVGEAVDIANNFSGNETNYSKTYEEIGESIGELGYYGVDIFGGASGIKSSVNAIKTNVTHLTSTYYYVGNYIDGFKRMNDLKIVDTPSTAKRIYEVGSTILNSSGIYYNITSLKDSIVDKLSDNTKEVPVN